MDSSSSSSFVPTLPNGWSKGSTGGRTTFNHESGGWTVSVLLYHYPSRFPPYYNFVSSSWVSIAPSDDGTYKKVLIIPQPNGKLPSPVEKSIEQAIKKKKAEGPQSIRLPVKLDRPVPKLPPGWSEKFRDGDYVKFEHKHSRIVVSELWQEEIEPGYTPTYFNFANAVRTTVRPLITDKVKIVGSPPPPPPKLPAPRIPMGWMKKYVSSDDDYPYFQEFKTGRIIARLYLEEPGIGPEGTSCYYDYAGQERFTLPPDLEEETDLIVNSKGHEIIVPKPEVMRYEEEDNSKATRPGARVIAQVKAGTVAAARSTFGTATTGFNKAELMRYHDEHRHHHQSTSSSSSSSSSNIRETVDDEPSPPQNDTEDHILPAGWRRIIDENDGDVYFIDSIGNAVWFLHIHTYDDEGNPMYYNCGTGVSSYERPPIDDDDPSSAIVSMEGQRVYTVNKDEVEPNTPSTVTAVLPSPTRTDANEEPLPEGWQPVIDEDNGDTYYYNASTGEAVWERPRG